MGCVHLTNENFDSEVIQSQTPVLVDFWAEWCGPCKMIGPIVEEVANEFQGKIKVTKLNIDESQEIAARYNIMSIPTLVLFKEGKPVDQVVGAVSKDSLIGRINQNL